MASRVEGERNRGDRVRGVSVRGYASDETKAAFKTTEFVAYVASVAAVLIASCDRRRHRRAAGMDPRHGARYRLHAEPGVWRSRAAATATEPTPSDEAEANAPVGGRRLP
jgi:hypothetical protein